MSHLNRFFKFLISRQTLVFVAIVAVAAAIWFIGPLIAFGDYRPLATVLARALSIVTLLAMLLFCLLGWSLGVIGAALLCLAIWYLGPLFMFGSVRPLASTGVRVLLIAVLVACYAAYGLYRLWKAMRSNDALLQRILNPFSTQASDDAPAREQIRAVNSVVTKAIDKVKQLRGGAFGLRRLLESQRYLYALPWYLVMGSPGAGKTTMILNSGLEFPDADQMVAASLGHHAETVNCDWWFGNDAILIDTAGRYLMHDMPARADEPDHAAGAVGSANAAEWRGFLALLRKRRPRAPVNGVLLVVSVEELLTCSPSELKLLAAAMRARLGELKHDLRIRYPAYLVVTKLDLLPGFLEYFQSLTAESRAQILGFTLPYHRDAPEERRDALRLACIEELRELEQGFEDGLNARLQEEYELDRRRRLYALPAEFRSLCAILVEFVASVFVDSKYDDTELNGVLRGVYFSSAAQTHDVVPADRDTLLQRLRRGLAARFGADAAAVSAPAPDGAAPVEYRGYFLRNLFQRVIVAEGHLVRPNLRWEIRFRALRVVGHLLSIAVAAWLVYGMAGSFQRNRDYLAAIDHQTNALAARVQAQRRTPKPGDTGALLSASLDLPRFGELDLDRPGIAWRYGLYAAPGVVDASSRTYAALLDQMLLPPVVARIATVLDGEVRAQNADEVYKTLPVYLMLYDPSHYDAKEVKAWVMRDWEQAGSVAMLGDRDVVAGHLDALFRDGVPVTPATPMDGALIKRARELLGRNSASGRLYERAMKAMEPDAPENITLARAGGPQALSVFAMAGDPALAQGVPGLYTYEGYHEVFTRRLPEFLEQAHERDAWLMGRGDRSSTWGRAGRVLRAGERALADEIRRQYLIDYGNYWQRFLDGVRLASGGAAPALDLQMLRTLSAPDSPLVRLARTAARETSLATPDTQDGPSLAGSAAAIASRRSRAASAVLAIGGATSTINRLARRRMEHDLVEQRFAALRAVVTGEADTDGGKLVRAWSASASLSSLPSLPSPGGGGPMQLDGIVSLIGERYTRLVLAGDVLATDSMPPADDLGATMRLEAEKLPAPFRAVLAGLAERSTQEVNRKMGALLGSRLEANVGDPCRSLIEGRYSFADSAQEVSIADFNRVFAAKGLLDKFFRETLADHVDTGSHPWRYRPAAPGMPPMRGPSLEPFERAAAIRRAFFLGPGASRLVWKLGIRVVSLDPDITELRLDIDGQSLRYAHGPVTTFPVTWPGPRGGSMAGITAEPQVSAQSSTLGAEGPWALFRLFDRGRLVPTSDTSRYTEDFDFDGRHAVLELNTGGRAGGEPIGLLKGFRCPGFGGVTGGMTAAATSAPRSAAAAPAGEADDAGEGTRGSEPPTEAAFD
ncbi:type VI secretion system membrane subunit TssM [Burkholderia glumae]|uniref:type VI secretion system membrane subunit TssM n=1 Tax=Burkholderia glumae TaxID=337 RepID=UPI0001A4A5B5|nr:type VI secretion system membrane subunit TssM [Burkholderia glumae]ACR30636.1 type VI secretion protein IcmF [Burkholderia glumae BGR1]